MSIIRKKGKVVAAKSKDELPKEPGRCGSCVKLMAIHAVKHECIVFYELIGIEKECWAWLGDECEWKKIKKQIEEYSGVNWRKYKDK